MVFSLDYEPTPIPWPPVVDLPLDGGEMVLPPPQYPLFQPNPWWNVRDAEREKRRLVLFSRQDGKCYWCQCQMSLERYKTTQTGKVKDAGDFASFEHLKPKSKGGTWRWKNIVLAHAVCNRMRHNPRFKNHPRYAHDPYKAEILYDGQRPGERRGTAQVIRSLADLRSALAGDRDRIVVGGVPGGAVAADRPLRPPRDRAVHQGRDGARHPDGNNHGRDLGADRLDRAADGRPCPTQPDAPLRA